MQYFHHKETVRSFECDFSYSLRPEILLGWLMEVSENHATQLGFGRQFCDEHSLGWFIVNLALSVKRWPKWSQTIRISTWTSISSAATATRECLLEDENGNELISASTKWALINIKRQAPIPLTRLPELLGHPLEPSPELKNYPLPKPRRNFTGNLVKSFSVEWNEIDFNRHVNNSVYLAWALNSLPIDFLKSHEISELAIAFHQQTLLGEKIDSWVEISSETTLHKLSCQDSPRATLELKWQPK